MEPLGMTKPLRHRRRRLTPAEFLRDLPEGIANLPPITGKSYRGPARLTRVEGHPAESIVEVIADETGYEFSLLDEPLLDGQPAYVALAALSEACIGDRGLGADALDACHNPTPDDDELVRKFVARFGLLSWGAGHDCYSERNAVCQLYDDGTRTWGEPISRFLAIAIRLSAESTRWGNSVAWILQEALILRRAMALWSALRRLRTAGDISPLRKLWGWRRGKTVLLFDDGLDHGPGNRWEHMVDDSVISLGRLINMHIREAAPAAALVPKSAWRSGNRSARAYWLRSEINFSAPLVGLWLQFYQDVLRESESGRSCRECKEVFSPKRIDQDFCSPRCGNRFRQRKHRISRQSREAAQ